MFEYDHEVVDESEKLEDYIFPVEQAAFFHADFFRRFGKAKAIYWVKSAKTTGKGVQSLETSVAIDTRGQNP
ncbi:hypothetical protein WI74_28575 [Burkholderia ubonensis]|nr:hypothetical protein WI74_28575 [Burkholderia ubonensis]